jgi:hypothetical protein
MERAVSGRLRCDTALPDLCEIVVAEHLGVSGWEALERHLVPTEQRCR